MKSDMQAQAREYPEAEKTLRLAAHLLIKAVLQYLPVLVPQPHFGECWQRILQVLQVRSVSSLRCRAVLLSQLYLVCISLPERGGCKLSCDCKAEGHCISCLI